jgi:signal transduction histidine kinase
MRLFHQIGIALVIAAVVPLGTAGLAVLSFNERALEAEVRGRFDQTAHHAALAVAADVEGRARQLTQTSALINWDELSADEVRGALTLIRRQSRALGTRYQPTVATAEPVDVLAAPELDATSLFAGAPVERASREGEGQVVFAPPSTLPGAEARVVAALKVPSGLLIAVLGLGPALRRLDEVRGGDDDLSLILIDDAGARLGAYGPEKVVPPAFDLSGVSGTSGATRRVLDGERTLLVGAAPVGGLGWRVLVIEDTQRAFAVPRRLRRLTLLASIGAALIAVGAAFFFARRLAMALERLSAIARKLGHGDLSARVNVDEGAAAEVAGLGRTFNAMGAEIQANHAALEASRAEIAAWNNELEARVEARTRELKDAQAQLLQAQKLAALGQLGAGVAHEINNPLAGVLGHVQLLLTDRATSHPDYESLKCIDEGARRASEVVGNLLRFSVQRKDPVRTSVDVNRVVKETLTLTAQLLAERHIEVDVVLAAPPPRVRADAGQIAQVLLNLVQNARTAMPGGGTLHLETRMVDGTIELIVGDTGKGIAPDIQERIFEPFFTTKDEWSNVGLGLSVSFRIVEEHGGRITVASELGHGATFTVYLPA